VAAYPDTSTILILGLSLRSQDANSMPSVAPGMRMSETTKSTASFALRSVILGALRDGNGQPVTTAAVVTAILKAGGHGEAARGALASPVRSDLAYLERRHLVTKLGDRTSACWQLS
jgi:hypothetical protein